MFGHFADERDYRPYDDPPYGSFAVLVDPDEPDGDEPPEQDDACGHEEEWVEACDLNRREDGDE